MPSVISDQPLAILAVDPGGTSGVAAAYVPRLETLRESLLAADNKKAAEVGGNFLEQAVKIAEIMHRFVFVANVENQIPLDDIHIVFEDFVLHRKRQGGATGNLTSCWVMAAAIALFRAHPLRELDGEFTLRGYELWDGVQIHYQQASIAKGKAPNQRLKLWGLYEPGSEHCKDAWRHLARLADTLL